MLSVERYKKAFAKIQPNGDLQDLSGRKRSFVPDCGVESIIDELFDEVVLNLSRKSLAKPVVDLLSLSLVEDIDAAKNIIWNRAEEIDRLAGEVCRVATIVVSFFQTCDSELEKGNAGLVRILLMEKMEKHVRPITDKLFNLKTLINRSKFICSV